VANADAADFAGEARRLRWAARYVALPQVLGVGLPDPARIDYYRRLWRAEDGASR
jgi:aminoglycoside phosphotransferase